MSTQLVTRSTPGGSNVTIKDEPLTSFEIDSNFISLKDNKLESDSNLSDLTDVVAARNVLNVPSTNGSNAFGTWNISISGNAAEATKLQNPVNIQGVAFDGTQDINIVTGLISSGFGISNFDDWDYTTDFTISVNDQEIVTIAGDQTISGQKTFSEAVILSTAGTASNHAVRGDRDIIAGDGLSGGGDLTADRTLSVDTSVVRTSRTISAGDGLDGGGSLASNRSLSVDSSVVRTSREVIAGTGLTGGGDLGSNVTLNVDDSVILKVFNVSGTQVFP